LPRHLWADALVLTYGLSADDQAELVEEETWELRSRVC